MPVDKVSVIIPCRNEAAFIGRCLDSLLANDYPQENLEVLVVDGGSTDGTRDIVRARAVRDLVVQLVDNPKKIFPAAVNAGVEQSTGNVIVIMGAHAIYPPDYILQCVKALNESGADNVGGVLIHVPGSNSVQAQAIAISLQPLFGSGGARFRFGTNSSRWVDTVFGGCYRRDVFARVGPFNENLVGSSDMDFNIRLRRSGGRILCVPTIKVYYFPRASLTAFARKNYHDGFWALYPLQFGVNVASWRHLMPAAFVFSLVGAGLLSLLIPVFILLLAGIITAYAAVSVSTSMRVVLTEKKQMRYVIFLPLAFAARHVPYGLGSLWAIVRLLMAKDFRQNLVKRLFDVSVASVGLIALGPVLSLFALWIKLDSSGPVFYRGVRVGKFGTPFRILKFRTMIAAADTIGGPSTADDDPRITRVGRLIRKYKLDELPQLFNVLKGEMSLVGPRPEVPDYVAMFTPEERAILTVAPGMTDWASLWDSDEGATLAGSKDPEAAYLERIRPQKVKLQLEYVSQHSLRVDLSILVDTFKAVILRW